MLNKELKQMKILILISIIYCILLGYIQNNEIKCISKKDNNNSYNMINYLKGI